jgi:hypothetical protein
MYEHLESIENVAHIIQVALTPVFLLSGIASLLSVLSTRLGRVADRVDGVAAEIETATGARRRRLAFRLKRLRRRSHILDFAVIMGALGGISTAFAALMLFLGTLIDRPGITLLIAFGFALVLTVGALGAFLIEMLLASQGIRDQAAGASEAGEAPEPQHEGAGQTANSADLS